MIAYITDLREMARFGTDPFGVLMAAGNIAYGDQPFTGVWAVGKSAVLGRLNRQFTLCGTLSRAVGAELAEFLPMLGCNALLAPPETNLPGWHTVKSGVVLRYDGTDSDALSDGPASAYCAILSDCASDWIRIDSPDSFYVDLSHRLRHACIHGRIVYEDAKPVACALTSGETDCAAVIGGVGCLPAYRGRGYARRAVQALCALQARKRRAVYLMTGAHLVPFYRKCGFTPFGAWNEYQPIANEC